MHVPVGRCARRPDRVAVRAVEFLPRAYLVLLSPLEGDGRRDQRAEDLIRKSSSTE